MAPSLIDVSLRVALTAVQKMRKSIWFFTLPKVAGAHAFAITPGGKLILVTLRYVPGWRLPGGGIDKGEDAQAAALRELREEIGMSAHGHVAPAGRQQEDNEFRRETASLFIVCDVAYRPRWSLEIEAVAEFGLDDLPKDISPRTLRWIAAARPQLR